MQSYLQTHRSLVLQRSTGGCSAQQRFIKKLPSLSSFLVQKRTSAGIQLSGACENPLVHASTKPLSFWSSLHHPCSTAPSRASVIGASSSASSSMSVPQDGKGDEEEDLWQFPDRASWYAPRFAASDQPDWNPARFVRSVQLGPNMREVTVEIEISRERVPLRNAYKHIGQRAAMRVNGGVEQYAYPTVPPFPMSVLREGLLKVRNDLSANEVKQNTEPGSALAELSLLVTKEESPALYNCSEEDALECGPFQGYGLDLKGGIGAVFLCPTIVIFCEGQGIATARALMAATTDVGGLSFKLRTDVRMYYRVRFFCFSAILYSMRRCRYVNRSNVIKICPKFGRFIACIFFVPV